MTAGNDDPTRTLICQVLGAVAQFEKAVIVSKLKGRKPYGTRPGEADVVALIHNLRRKPRGGERVSFAAIAQRLNAEGRPSRGGKPWAPETVRQIATPGRGG